MITLERHALPRAAGLKLIEEPYDCCLLTPKGSTILGLSRDRPNAYPEVLIAYNYGGGGGLDGFKHEFRIVAVGTDVPEGSGKFLGSFSLDCGVFGSAEFAVFHMNALAPTL